MTKYLTLGVLSTNGKFKTLKLFKPIKAQKENLKVKPKLL